MESPERPTLPSIFGHDQPHASSVAAAMERDRAYAAGMYDGGMPGTAYPPVAAPPTSVTAVPPYATHGYPQNYAPRPDYSQQRNATYPGPAEQHAHHPQYLAADQHAMSYDSLGGEEQKTKRRRGNLPKSTTDILKGWFHEHLDHPYPSEEEKQILMCRTRLTMCQVGGLCGDDISWDNDR
jgi:hypothetical protein